VLVKICFECGLRRGGGAGTITATLSASRQRRDESVENNIVMFATPKTPFHLLPTPRLRCNVNWLGPKTVPHYRRGRLSRDSSTNDWWDFTLGSAWRRINQHWREFPGWCLCSSLNWRG